VHRSDGSGTTKIFVDYLTAVSPAWKKRPRLPATASPGLRGLGAKGNEGVSGQVQSTPGAIGYIELVYALQNKMSYAASERRWQVRLPTLESVTAAGRERPRPHAGRFPHLHRQRRGRSLYPISGFTYLLVHKEQNAAKGKALVDFLKWARTRGRSSPARSRLRAPP
jgi:phosphate transport system substrate-binding protein